MLLLAGLTGAGVIFGALATYAAAQKCGRGGNGSYSLVSMSEDK